jgi:hypothetical protein
LFFFSRFHMKIVLFFCPHICFPIPSKLLGRKTTSTWVGKHELYKTLDELQILYSGRFFVWDFKALLIVRCARTFNLLKKVFASEKCWKRNIP